MKNNILEIVLSLKDWKTPAEQKKYYNAFNLLSPVEKREFLKLLEVKHLEKNLVKLLGI